MHMFSKISSCITLFLAFLIPMQAEAAGVLTIKSGPFYNVPISPFSVGTVVSNTLLKNSPADSNITIPVSGNYIATTSVYVCTGGSWGYVNSYVYLNGNQVANAVNTSKECGTAAATASVYAKAGDIISGRCAINQGILAQCSFSLALID